MVEIGKVLQGRYQVLQDYKDGGHGITYLVVDTHLPTQPLRILKKLKSFGEIKEEQRPHYERIKEKFKKEALFLDMIGKGSGGRVPELFDSFEEDGTLYLVQEFVNGQTLLEKLASDGPLTVSEAVSLLNRLLGTLDYIHSFKCVHRDVNPANIVIREGDGTPVLIDFGIVKELLNEDADGKTSVAFGKEGYMPVEQINRKVLPASDIYALGVTMIVMLTGKAATELFDIESFCVEWRGLIPGIDEGLAKILDKAVHFRARDRYQSAGEMLGEVSGLTPPPGTAGSSGGSIVVLPPTEPPRPEPGKPFTNSMGMRFAWIPAGKFWMGSHFSDREEPIHEVTMPRGFHLGMYQVTQKQWREMMPDKPNPSRFRGDDFPVESVSWDDAVKFLERLNEREQTTRYRLPNEAEWEYACQAGMTGAHAGELEEMGWYDKNSGGTTHLVGKKKANGWGLYDMHGNVWEWCGDVWHDNYDGAPSDGSAWMEGGDQGRLVVRGGSFNGHSSDCRSAWRSKARPGNRRDDLGFRVLISAETP